MWTLHKQQQHCGAQLHARAGKPRQPGEPPAEATADREAQQHDLADLQVSGSEEPRRGDYPATNPPDRAGDITPTAPEPHVEWDDVVQPERADARRRSMQADEQPLPEGK